MAVKKSKIERRTSVPYMGASIPNGRSILKIGKSKIVNKGWNPLVGVSKLKTTPFPSAIFLTREE